MKSHWINRLPLQADRVGPGAIFDTHRCSVRSGEVPSKLNPDAFVIFNLRQKRPERNKPTLQQSSDLRNLLIHHFWYLCTPASLKFEYFTKYIFYHLLTTKLSERSLAWLHWRRISLCDPTQSKKMTRCFKVVELFSLLRMHFFNVCSNKKY